MTTTINRQYHRSGTLWEGRYKSCLVKQENYLLKLYRYIELNPVRAGMVDDPADYTWSSYQCNGLGKKTDLLTPYAFFCLLVRMKNTECYLIEHCFNIMLKASY
ncbi:transposase [Paraglaciecola sp.]|uniref:transposase n=1 Tax=Paraglaciecola sp. TaxID=1920173 RepID=UPI003EF4301F